MLNSEYFFSFRILATIRLYITDTIHRPKQSHMHDNMRAANSVESAHKFRLNFWFTTTAIVFQHKSKTEQIIFYIKMRLERVEYKTSMPIRIVSFRSSFSLEQ